MTTLEDVINKFNKIELVFICLIIIFVLPVFYILFSEPLLLMGQKMAQLGRYLIHRNK